MDQFICASLSHTHYWYKVGMLKVPTTVHIEEQYVDDKKSLKNNLNLLSIHTVTQKEKSCQNV